MMDKRDNKEMGGGGNLDSSQQQQLLSALLSQLVQGISRGGGSTGESDQGKGMLVNAKEVEREMAASGDNLQRKDKGNESGIGNGFRNQMNRAPLQQNMGEDRNRSDRLNRQVCGKCKDPRHSTMECKVGHCLICGRDNHITRECNLLKQMKPVPKYVGYAAKGLECY
jgi:hypothetical protein